jgi:uncharacterized membrane protein YeaQ/YmgE (transglycosylase-associated protein family)
MFIVGYLILAALTGWAASIVTDTNDQMGCIANTAAGLLGMALGSVLTRVFTDQTLRDLSFINGALVSILGAVIVIIILHGVPKAKQNR